MSKRFVALVPLALHLKSGAYVCPQSANIKENLMENQHGTESGATN